MAAQPNPGVSPGLRAVLDRYQALLDSDDVHRVGQVAALDESSLAGFVAAVTPLFAEINDVLDQLGAFQSLSEEQQDLVVALNDLGQAGVEAQIELEARAQK